MSQMYYNYFLMCYTKEPPTVTQTQLDTALQKGMITQSEYDAILASKAPQETAETAPQE